ncbi:GDSL-like Lipase/Acylhydrolase family protein [Corynebacterium mycetoides]|uniref:GDSL-like Lipase/Acylhydrolase family protein n=1 Tax=Corynebacterium mycetoides TaxID=38302 RepID=A0A1G9PJ85_9CORY|nr:SGNH/GDSL hydrolase family protein [Corynebacterium mycetoides]SDL98886.1 GDSL-like Lipase/Acylhydrolase family protein [Corynebacterium mycetoides]
MRRWAAAVAGLLASSFALSGCQSEPIDHVGTHTSVAPPLGVVPTLDADPTRVEATEMAQAIDMDPSDIRVYVALGDSYAAMGSATGEKADPSFCAQSKDNYPNELAGMLGRSVEFVDATCQGSTTANIEGPRVVPEEDVSIEPQINQLRSDADLVTVSMGGNDIGFAEIARCINDMLSGSDRNCAEEFALPLGQAMAELPTKLTDMHAAIREKAPGAVVVATGYSPLVSMEQQCAITDNIGREGVEWAVWLTAAINNLVKQSAEASGAIFALPEDVERHTTCAVPKQRWVSIDGTDTNSYPAHPTPKGQHEMAETVTTVLGR